MTPDQIRATLARLGLTQYEFARLLDAWSDLPLRSPPRSLRAVQRWCKDTPPGPSTVGLLRLMELAPNAWRSAKPDAA